MSTPDQPLQFANSYSRLGWVEELAATLDPVISAANAVGQAPEIGYEIADHPDGAGFTHVRYSTSAFEISPNVGFRTADMVVNARSCLDMAVQEVVDAYGPPGGKPQFPIDNDVQKTPSGMSKTLKKQLPEQVWAVIAALQPHYDTPWGHVDFPINSTALWIRDVANTNKHRNITPVTVTENMSGYQLPAGQPLQHVDSTMISAWPDRPRTFLELRFPTGSVSERVLQNEIRPFVRSAAHLQKSGLVYEDPNGPGWDIPMAQLLVKVPAYVRHALRTLQRAEQHVRDPHGEFRPNRRIDL